MNRKFAWGAATAAAILCAGFWAWREQSEPGSPQSPAVATNATEGDADPSITLAPDARARAGIQTFDVRAVEAQTQAIAIATALPMQDLIDSASAQALARSQVERANAALEASRRDRDRVASLHAQDRNMSDRALELAEATWRADEASAQAAATALQAAQAAAKVRWGSVLAQEMATGAQRWLDLTSGRQALLRVAPASGSAPASMPTSIEVELPSGQYRQAKLLSQSPSSDPRIQATAHFYAMDGREVSTGQTLEARFAFGAKKAGAVLPSASLLWWQGKQWMYVEKEPGRFERREAVNARRTADGWFVPGFGPAKVVSRGAQSLLSQELRSAIQVGEDDK